MRPFPFHMPWSYQIDKCIAKCLYSYWDSLLQNILGITTAQDAICSLPLPIGCMGNIRTQDTNQTAQPPYKTMKNVIIRTYLFFFQLGIFFHLYKIYNGMQSRLARKPIYHLIWERSLPTKDLLFLITKHPRTVYSIHYQNNYKVSKEFDSHTKS